MKHATRLSDFGPGAVELILSAAKASKGQPHPKHLQDKILGMVFFNPSLRTRASFEAVMARGGGSAIVIEGGSGTWKLEDRAGAVMDGDRAEHVKEAAPVLSRYVDALAVRSFAGGINDNAAHEDAVMRAFRQFATVPTISMESAREHPCQGLADLLTIVEQFGSARGLPVTLTWSPHIKPLPKAVPNSFLLTAAALGCEIRVAHPEGFELHSEILREAESYSQASGGSMPELESAWSTAGIAHRLVLIDLSGDFRIPDPAAFERNNGFPHPCAELLPRFVYGLPEWNRAAISGAKRIASPGCFATALQLGLLPLRGLNVGFIAASAMTGSSGSGATPSVATHHPTRANDFRAYKILEHQHMVEVQMAMNACGISATVGFVPHSAPFIRGVFATLQFAMPADLDSSQLCTRAAAVFESSPFVRLLEESPRVAAVAGSNFADVNIVACNRSAAILVALDNLGKGMVGQAVQTMNISLGIEETRGLWQPGRFPA